MIIFFAMVNVVDLQILKKALATEMGAYLCYRLRGFRLATYSSWATFTLDPISMVESETPLLKITFTIYSSSKRKGVG